MTTCGELRQMRGDKSIAKFAEELKVSAETLKRNEKAYKDLPVTQWLQTQINKNYLKIAPKPPKEKKVYDQNYFSFASRTARLREAIIKSYTEKV
jgi:Zn-dependent peptidase ImmA (M78 family)